MHTDHLDGSGANFDGWDDPSILPRRRKTGGRKKGTPNKRTAARQAAIAAITASGKDPISFFADLLKNEQAPLELRFQAAKELAPYTHPKLASIESRTGGQTHEDRLKAYQNLLSEEGKPKRLIEHEERGAGLDEIMEGDGVGPCVPHRDTRIHVL
jgi:hypothetical protein